jgi:hypothetical protein
MGDVFFFIFIFFTIFVLCSLCGFCCKKKEQGAIYSSTYSTIHKKKPKTKIMTHHAGLFTISAPVVITGQTHHPTGTVYVEQTTTAAYPPQNNAVAMPYNTNMAGMPMPYNQTGYQANVAPYPPTGTNFSPYPPANQHIAPYPTTNPAQMYPSQHMMQPPTYNEAVVQKQPPFNPNFPGN